MSQLRIGVARQGDVLDPAAWSGVVAALIDGLRQAGAEVVPVPAHAPRFRRLNSLWLRTYAAELADAPTAAVCSAAAARALRRAGHLDGVIQLGSGFTLPPGTRFVTFDDMTVRQARKTPDEPYRKLSERAVQRWIARQARIFESAAGCCAMSHWAAESIIGDYGIDPARVHVVGTARNEAAAPVARDWSRPRFLFVGREWERKNGPRLLRAFARVHAEHPEARLDLVGGHPPVDEPGVFGHGMLRHGDPDAQRRLRDLLQGATCLVMVATYEPFGAAFVDAGGAGLPSIGSSVGGARDAIGPGGLVVDPDGDDALANAMLRLSDPAFAERLGTAAIAHARLFDRRVVAERMLRALLGDAAADAQDLAPHLQAATPPAVAADHPA